MSGIFGRPKVPDIPKQPEPVADVRMVKEDAETAGRRERKKLQAGGRKTTILSGIQSALKKRLGE